MSKLDDLRGKFTTFTKQFSTQHSRSYSEAAGLISKNDGLQQRIFENLIHILQSENLVDAKKAATHALQASNELDENLHFLLSHRTKEHRSSEVEFEKFAAEFNKSLDVL